MSKSVVTRHKFGDKDYALVPDRIKEFREGNPRGKITTSPQFLEDGSCIFSATILKDKADKSSAEAAGTARYTAKEMEKAKAFEKLETISVGRALANLGYLNDGQVATTEEMEEFEEYRSDRAIEEKNQAIEKLETATTLAELKETYFALGELMTDEDVIKVKDARKEQLNAPSKN